MIVRSREAQLHRISIGGAHCSMGGQTSLKDSVHLDLSQFNQILNFDRENKLITIQTGISWRKVIEFIDQYGFSVMVMQSYADFTVGGSLSVNAHGRHIRHGSISETITEMKIVLGNVPLCKTLLYSFFLANGTLVQCTPLMNDPYNEVFFGAIGGYGGLGVIVEVTLQLTNNVKLERVTEVMSLSEYEMFFRREIRQNQNVQLHNANIELLPHAISMWQRIP